MPSVRKKVAAHQRSPKADVPPPAASVNDRSVAVSRIHAWIPLGLKAVEEALLQQEVVALAGARARSFSSTRTCPSPCRAYGMCGPGPRCRSRRTPSGKHHARTRSACFVRCGAGSRAGSTRGPPRPCLKRSGSRSRACRVASFGRVRRRCSRSSTATG